MLTIRPDQAEDSILNTPGRGWESNNRTLMDLQNSPHPPSRVAYFKYYLKTFLREDGMMDLSQLADDLNRAQASGQQLAFRLMIFSEEEGGEILRFFGATQGRSYRYIDGDERGAEHWAPDLDDEATLAALRKLLLALGKRFDGNPSLSHIDIGYVGLWGEWHTSDTVPRVPMPSFESQKRIIDMHFEAFPRTLKIMQLQSAPSLRYALDKGAGIRADCLASRSTTMMKLYPLTLFAARAQDAWKQAPFIFEICWNLDDWVKKSWDSEEIFSIAVNRYHASLINTKSASIPAAVQPAFEGLLRRIGYRFSVRELRHPAAARIDSPFSMQIHFENKGSAPCYSDMRVLIRLKSKTTPHQVVLPTTAQMCGKLPGNFSFNLAPKIPDSAHLVPGDYNVAVGLAERDSLTPTIQLANTKPEDGWYWFSSMQLK